VYFIYGNYFCTNVSCMPEGDAAGVLLRAMEPVLGVEAMAEARGLIIDPESRPSQLRLISSGPGRMSEALGITRARDNGKDLTDSQTGLWFADDGYRPERVVVTPRVGIKKAIEEPLRFIVAGNPYVSGTRVR
jgi:DNA-3-methyladenine glycosylase